MFSLNPQVLFVCVLTESRGAFCLCSHTAVVVESELSETSLFVQLTTCTGCPTATYFTRENARGTHWVGGTYWTRGTHWTPGIC